MRKGSNKYRRLAKRLDQLRNHLLFFLRNHPVSSLLYSDEELDFTRAYIVLAHAEIEAFCEEIVQKKAQDAKAAFDNNHKVQPILRRMVTYYAVKNGKSWGNVMNPSVDVVNSAFQSYQDRVRKNHGVKIENLEKLLFPLGIQDRHLSSTWLADMDSFGSDRGAIAHTSIGVQRPPDPVIQLNNVARLLSGLLDLDRIFGRLR
jgi:hypothetical protein